jgi:hypothetical protein
VSVELEAGKVEYVVLAEIIDGVVEHMVD